MVGTFLLTHFPKVTPRIFKTGTSCHLGVVVLIKLTRSVFNFLGTFDNLLNLKEVKLVLPNIPQIE